MTRQDTDDETLDGLVMSQDPAGNTQAGPEVDRDAHRRHVRPAARRDDAAADRRRPTRRRRLPRRPPRDRPRAAWRCSPVGARASTRSRSRRPRSVVAALDPERYEVRRSRSAATAAGRCPPATGAAALPAATAAETLPVPTDSRSRDARRRRRRAARSCTARSARTAPSRASRARRRPVRRLRACRVGALHGQGPLQGRDARTAASRSRAASRSGPATAVENPFGYPVFVKPARLGLVGRDLEGPRRRRSWTRPSRSRSATTTRCSSRSSSRGVEVEVRRPRQPRARSPRVVGRDRRANADWYDYVAKYDDGGMELVVPPPGSRPSATERVRELAVAAFVATDVRGDGARRLLRPRPDGEVVVNELNTIPGFTATSVYARLFAASGIAYAELLDRLVELALERHERRKRSSSTDVARAPRRRRARATPRRRVSRARRRAPLPRPRAPRRGRRPRSSAGRGRGCSSRRSRP